MYFFNQHRHSFHVGRKRRPSMKKRRGAVAVFAVVMMVVIIGFGALTLDVGAMYNTRCDLQNAADSAAMASASAYATPAMLQIRQSKNVSAATSEVFNNISTTASQYSLLHRSLGRTETKLESGDVVRGYLDLNQLDAEIDTAAPASSFNAVRILLRRDSQSQNGALELTFAAIFGKNDTDVTASATAAFDDRMSGYDPYVPGAAELWPFTMHKNDYQYWLNNPVDAYKYDSDSETVSSGSDDALEVRLYPEKLASGNFGLLNIGNIGNGTGGIADHIKNGIPDTDLEDEIGTPVLQYVDDDGDPITHNIGGTPGLKASLQGDIKSRVGDVVAIFIHDQTTGNGSNVKYRTTGVRFVRVMNANLNGGNKAVWVQPVSYDGPGVTTHPSAPSSGGAAGKVVLVR